MDHVALLVGQHPLLPGERRASHDCVPGYAMQRLGTASAYRRYTARVAVHNVPVAVFGTRNVGHDLRIRCVSRIGRRPPRLVEDDLVISQRRVIDEGSGVHADFAQHGYCDCATVRTPGDRDVRFVRPIEVNPVQAEFHARIDIAVPIDDRLAERLSPCLVAAKCDGLERGRRSSARGALRASAGNVHQEAGCCKQWHGAARAESRHTASSPEPGVVTGPAVDRAGPSASSSCSNHGGYDARASSTKPSAAAIIARRRPAGIAGEPRAVAPLLRCEAIDEAHELRVQHALQGFFDDLADARRDAAGRDADAHRAGAHDRLHRDEAEARLIDRAQQKPVHVGERAQPRRKRVDPAASRSRRTHRRRRRRAGRRDRSIQCTSASTSRSAANFSAASRSSRAPITTQRRPTRFKLMG